MSLGTLEHSRYAIILKELNQDGKSSKHDIEKPNQTHNPGTPGYSIHAIRRTGYVMAGMQITTALLYSPFERLVSGERYNRTKIIQIWSGG